MKSTGKCIGALLSLLAAPLLAAAKPQPKIHVDKPVCAFGKIWNDKPLDHTFEIKNVGQAPLEVKRTRTSCGGCFHVAVKPQALAPGASTQIKIRLLPQSLKGKVTKTVHIESNDPARPMYPLKFTGEVRKTITMSPEMARFDRIDRVKPSTLKLTLTNHFPTPMTLSNPVSTVPNVSAEVTEVERGKKFKVVLTAKPPYTRSIVYGKVTLNTGVPDRPPYAINFFGRLPPAVEIRPTKVIKLGTLERAKQYVRTVRIVSTDGEPFEITEVSSSNWRIMPVVRQIREKLEYEVQITARPPYDWGANRAHIMFQTRSAGSPKLLLQVQGDLPPPIKVGPASVLFRDLRVDRGGVASVMLEVQGTTPVTLSSVRSTLPNVKPELEVVTPGKRYRLTATASPPFPPGRLEGEVAMDTTHPDMKTLAVPVQSFPIPAPQAAVTVLPDPVLVLPAPHATKPVVSRFIVQANGNQKVRVTKVEVSCKDIAAWVEPQKGNEGNRTYVRVSVPPGAKLRPEGEIITFYANPPGAGKVTRRIARSGTPGASARRLTRLARPASRPSAPGLGRSKR